MWDSSNNRFNQIVLKDIIDKIFKQEDPVSFIKDNGKEDYETYGKKAPSPENGIEYFVVPATVINNNVGNANYGMVIKLDGKWWMATALTLDRNGNVVLTLMTATSYGSSSSWWSGDNAKAKRQYTNSNVYNTLINTDSTWSFFRSTSEFATKYLVQPKYIQYQRTEHSNLRYTSWPDLANEAVGESTSTYGGDDFKYLPDKEDENGKYFSWGDDYIWIPSFSEAGTNDKAHTTCIWKQTSYQRAHSNGTKNYAWYRSVHPNKGGVIQTAAAGDQSYSSTGSYPLQPCIHLNLTAAGLGQGLENPSDVTTTYNDKAQTIKSVYDADNSNVSWFDPAYTDPDRVTLSFQDDKGNTVTEMKNAGTYSVKIDITKWIKAVEDQIALEAGSSGWSADEIAAAKEMRRPRFKGSLDTTKTIKFLIKPIELDIPTAAEPSKTYTGSDIEFAISGYDSAKMSATPPTGFTLSNDGKISFKNAKTYPISISIKDNNYCWKGTSSNPDRSAKTINITVTQKGIIINFTSSSDKFSMAVGENVTFTAVPSESDIVAGDTVIPTITYYKGSDTANITSATGAELNASGLSTGTYTLGAKLENKDGTANGNYKITTVTPKTVTVGSKTITIENVTWQYVQDADPTEISGNSVVLTYNGKEFRFTVKETTEELRAKGVKIDTSYGSNGYTNGVQTNATDGTVTVKVKLVPYDESFEFSDPTQTEVEFSLTVTINKIELKLSDFKWSAEPSNELEYTGNTQTVTIVSGLPSFLQVTYDGNSGLSVGPYTAIILSITVKNDAESLEMSKNYTSFEPEDYEDYEYKWQITKKKIVANWTNEEHTTTNGKKVSIPKVSGVEDGILEYSYTKYPSGEAVTLAEILASYSETEISVYNVTVKIADGKTDSYMLLNSKNEVKDEVTQRFSVGDNKKAVTVSLQETKVYFNNQPQAVKLSYTGEGITANDFAVEYKLLNADGSEGEATNVAPTAVGKYKVTITLQGEKANTHIIVGENVFEYVIAHKDRFILTEAAAASHPYKFLYEDFHEYEQDIKEYLYNAENAESVVYIAHLAFEDTLADLLRQFANAEDITAYGADGTLIEDLTAVLATGMMLRMMDGETVLNQLTISVMGDIDGDGDIGTADKARLNSYTLGNLELKGAYLLACDLDSDGEVGTADKARLNAYTLGNLDIYVGLILRATAQATSATDEPVFATATTSPQTLLAAEERVFAVSAQATSKAFTACDELAVVDESEPAVVTSATTETAPLTTTAHALSTDESESVYETSVVTTCEIAIDIATEGNEITSAYTASTDIKQNSDYAMCVYANCKQRA